MQPDWQCAVAWTRTLPHKSQCFREFQTQTATKKECCAKCPSPALKSASQRFKIRRMAKIGHDWQLNMTFIANKDSTTISLWMLLYLGGQRPKELPMVLVPAKPPVK